MLERLPGWREKDEEFECTADPATWERRRLREKTELLCVKLENGIGRLTRDLQHSIGKLNDYNGPGL